MMDLFGGGELGLLGGGEGLRDDVGVAGINWTANPLPDDMYPASGFALAAAYHDIKTRLASLERENSSIKRKLKHYEVKFPMISGFGEEKVLCCSCETVVKETSSTLSETNDLQQKINSLTQELQDSKEREERLEDVIQAYEKIHLEKTNVQRDLDKMTTLAEQHVERIRSLEMAVRERDTALQKLSIKLHNKDASSPANSSLNVPRESRGATLQSSCSLDALSDLKLQRLEAELEGARHKVEGACQREKELRVELQRLQQEVAQLQKAQRQEMTSSCEHCDVEWIKKAGDEQVNLALAYTELTEELGRVHRLAAKQSELLHQNSQEPVSRPPPAPQHVSPTSPQHPSLTPDRLFPSPSPPTSPVDGPTSASYSHRPTSSRLRAKFQGRRSYSEVSDPSALHRLLAGPMRDPVSTLPKPRSLLGGSGGYPQTKPQLRTSLIGLVRPASAHGGGGERGGGEGGGGGRGGGSSLSNSPHHRALDLVDLDFPLAAEVHHFCRLEDPPEPTPLVTPPQSSDDEEEWVCPSLVASPPCLLGATGIGSSSPREQPPHPSFSAPEGAATLSCHLPAYINSEHAQSWPSINLWMESEENAMRSCPLCQLTFPTGYPDDALIKHIDSHLENSKI